MQQMKLLKTITALFVIFACAFSLCGCQRGRSFAFVTDAYSASIGWEYGGHTFRAELYVGASTDSGRTVHMKLTSPESLSELVLYHAGGRTKLTHGELTLGKEMTARYLAIAQCAVPNGGLSYLSRTENGGDVYVDADGRWWYFDKGSPTPSAAEYKGLKITFESFSAIRQSESD